MNQAIVSKAPKMGEALSDRKLAYFVHGHNAAVPSRRGLAHAEPLAATSWRRELLLKAFVGGVVKGEPPGGSSPMPPPVSLRGTCYSKGRHCVTKFVAGGECIDDHKHSG